MDDLEQILTPKEARELCDAIVEAEMIEAQFTNNNKNKRKKSEKDF